MAANKNQMRPITRNLKAPPPPRFMHNQMHAESKIAAAFKTNVLALKSVNKIRISHIENGPFLFYVQLEASDSEFQQMVMRLQKMQLQRIKPQSASMGMACLALHDKKIFRVAIARTPQHSYEDVPVNFVDFGFNKSIKLDNLFYIPDEFLGQYTFARPFAIAGCKTTNIKVNEKEIGFYFRHLIEKQQLTLKCVPFDGPPNCQYCELLIDNKVNVLDELKLWDPYGLNFRQQNDLEMIVHDVKVSYVDSAQEFYIHLQKPEILLDYDLTSDELQVMSRSPQYRNPKPGSCCSVFLGGEYYRGIVIGATKSKQTIQVKIVDFGIVEEIPEKHIHLLTEKFVEKPPQAYRACLKGFESQEVSENISTQFEIFCGDGRGERKVFKMTIQDKFKDSYLVELEDPSVNPSVNVNKLLLKNSRPLIETIQMENAKKRHKDSKNFNEHDAYQDGNNPQRNGGNKGPQRNAPSNNPEPKQQQSPRTHFGKARNDESSVAGTYYKSSKEASVWGSKESTPSDHNSIKSSDWDQPKNISREQNSSATWNESNESHKNQKGKNSKGAKHKANSREKKTNANSGWVSTLLSVNRAFVHYDEHVEGLQKILDEMFAFYENNSRSHVKDLQVGTECAVRSSDGNWYRSKVNSINGDKVAVFHREYGNTETVRMSKIRLLDEKFAKMSDLAVETFFPIKPLPESDEKSLFNEMMKIFENGAKEFNFKVVQKINDGWILEPIDPTNSRNVIDELVKAGKATRVSSNELQQLLDYEKPKGVLKKERKSPEKPKQIADPKLEVKLEVNPEAKLEVVQEIKQAAKPQKIKKEKSPIKEKSPPAAKEKSPEPRTDIVAVKMTALTSPTDFYISLFDEIPSFIKLHADIQIIATGAAPLKEFEEGALCLAQQPFDLCWYRAKIIDSDETEQHSMITVRCVDDGKTFSVDDKTFLKIMPVALGSKKFFGIACTLPVKIERKCEEDATDLMMKMMDIQLQASFISGTENELRKFVELLNDSGNVSDILVEQKLAHRLEIISPGKGYTSHINSLSSFYLQFEMDQLKLDLISQYFEEANGNFENIEAKEGMIVAALFPDDECWYRARIESVESDGFSVTFIDYGNTCLVKQIGTNSESTIWELPAMSRHCTLAKPKSIKRFADDAEAKFVDICASGATILDVKSSPVNPGEAAEVELFLNGKNIVDELIQFCEVSDGIMDRTIDSTDLENLMSQHE